MEALPKTSHVAVLWNLANPVSSGFRSDLEKAADSRSVQVQFIDVREPAGLDQAFRRARRVAQAAIVVCENLFIQNGTRVVERAAKYRLPTIYCASQFAHAGGFMAYGTDHLAMFASAAEYVDKILRGAKVGDLPLQQSTKFELVVNLKTAKALAVEVPQSIIIRADEIIR